MPLIGMSRETVDRNLLESLVQQLKRLAAKVDAANGSAVIQLGDAVGRDQLTVYDSKGLPALVVTSGGDLWVAGTIATMTNVPWDLGGYVEADPLSYGAGGYPVWPV